MLDQEYHCCATVLPNSKEIAKEYYWTVGYRDLDTVMDKLPPELAQKLAPK